MLHNNTSYKRFIIQHAKLLCPRGGISRRSSEAQIPRVIFFSSIWAGRIPKSSNLIGLSRARDRSSFLRYGPRAPTGRIFFPPNGRIYVRDELFVWDELHVWDGQFVCLGRIPRLGINSIFIRIMWLHSSSTDSSVSMSPRRADRQIKQ